MALPRSDATVKEQSPPRRPRAPTPGQPTTPDPVTREKPENQGSATSGRTPRDNRGAKNLSQQRTQVKTRKTPNHTPTKTLIQHHKNTVKAQNLTQQPHGPGTLAAPIRGGRPTP
jgi:hypothetical protein